MSFSDPISITVNGVAVSLPRVSSGPNSGSFQSADGVYRMDISHAYGKRDRRVIKLTTTRYAQSNTNSQLSVPASLSVALTVDAPKYGFIAAEEKWYVDALTALLTASSGAKVTQFLGGEN